MPTTILEIYKGNKITVTDGMLNLTSLWKACGRNQNRKPAEFLRWEGSQRLIDAVDEKLGKVGISQLINITKGRYGGTFAHPIIGLAYAKYLSPEFHIWCNEIFVTCNTLK